MRNPAVPGSYVMVARRVNGHPALQCKGREDGEACATTNILTFTRKAKKSISSPIM